MEKEAALVVAELLVWQSLARVHAWAQTLQAEAVPRWGDHRVPMQQLAAAERGLPSVLQAAVGAVVEEGPVEVVEELAVEASEGIRLPFRGPPSSLACPLGQPWVGVLRHSCTGMEHHQRGKPLCH